MSDCWMSDCWMVDSHKDDHRSGDLLTDGDRHIPAATCCRHHGWNNQTTEGVPQVGVLQVSDHC
jgi:hypothetical protein